MTGFADFRFEPIDQQFLADSRRWMDDTNFRSLIMADPVDPASQREWFENLPSRADYTIWGVNHRAAWIGAFGLKKIRRETGIAEYWGYIYPAEYRNRGLGRAMFDTCVEYARANAIGVLELTVSKDNAAAIRAYSRWGFEERGESPNTALRMEYAL